MFHIAPRVKLGREDNKRLFITGEGGKRYKSGEPLQPDSISDWFSNFIDKYKMPDITLHEVRHTAISYLLNNGVDIETVAERAGHIDSSVTSRIYGHVYKKNKRECANKYNVFFKDTDNTQK